MSKAVFKKRLWQQQLRDISALLKKSLKSSQKYARKIFQNQQQFYQSQSKRFISSLKKTQSITLTLSSQKIYNQLVQKLKALNQLFFPQRVLSEIDEIKIKNTRIERLLKLIQKSEVGVECKVLSENIRHIMQYESKLNMEENLFIFKAYLSAELQNNQSNKTSLLIKRQSFPVQTKLTMRVLHNYFQQQATKIICANLPTFGSYKPAFTKSIQSKQLKQFRDLQAKGQIKTLGQDNQANSKVCFTFFGHAMQFDFFNSLLQPISLESYIRRFSIIQDAAICRGLILGALQSLPNSKPNLEDSDEEEEWEDDVEKMAKEFCRFFQGYFDEEEENVEVLEISGRIAALRRLKNETVPNILKKYWCQ